MKFYRSDNSLFTLIILVLVLMFLPIFFIKIVMPLLGIFLVYKLLKNLLTLILDFFKGSARPKAVYSKNLSGKGIIVDIEAEQV